MSVGLSIYFLFLGSIATAAAVLITLDVRGLRTWMIQRDLRSRRWLSERHLWFDDQRPYGWKYFVLAGCAGLMGLFFIATGMYGLLSR